jgi:PKD repeat protein
MKPLTVQFTDASTGVITGRSWDFGDGQSSTQTNPSHIYANAGTYTVSLTVTGPGGSNTKMRSNYITVTEPAPAADFTGAPTSGVKPLTVQFTDASTGVITGRSWDFGDGQNSTQTNPSHLYANAGTYTVSLTLTGPGGGSIKSRPNYITVMPPVGVDERKDQEIPKVFALYPNYPNPFNPSTTIEYDLPQPSHIELKVYDVLGNEVQTLVSGKRAAGRYRVQFDSNGVPGGLYFYRLRTGEKVEVKKMMVVK